MFGQLPQGGLYGQQIVAGNEVRAVFNVRQIDGIGLVTDMNNVYITGNLPKLAREQQKLVRCEQPWHGNSYC